MSVAVVTGSAGLIGSEAVRFLHEQGMDVVGIDNDMRAYFFGPEASTRWKRDRLADAAALSAPSTSTSATQLAIARSSARYGAPSSWWSTAPPSRATTGPLASRSPTSRQRRRARSTCWKPTRAHAPTAAFIFTSTNKVYGDAPNELPLVETRDALGGRSGAPLRRARHRRDACASTSRKHSLFGASQARGRRPRAGVRPLLRAADRLLPRRLPDGPQHSGAELHGFLAYLVRAR